MLYGMWSSWCVIKLIKQREAEAITKQTIATLQQSGEAKESQLLENRERVDLLTQELHSIKKDFTDADTERKDIRKRKQGL